MADKKERKKLLKKLGYSKEEMNELWEACCEMSSGLNQMAHEDYSWKDLSLSQIAMLPEIYEKLKKIPLCEVYYHIDREGNPSIQFVNAERENNENIVKEYRIKLVDEEAYEHVLSLFDIAGIECWQKRLDKPIHLANAEDVVRASNILDDNEINYTLKVKEAELSLEEKTLVESEEIEDEYDTDILNGFEEEIIRKIENGHHLSEQEMKELLFDGYEVCRENGENRRWSRTVESVIQLCGRYFMIEWEEGLTESQENEFYNQPYEVYKTEYPKTITVTEWSKEKPNPEQVYEVESVLPSDFMNPPEEPEYDEERE